MSEPFGEFHVDTYAGLLGKIVEHPPSDRQLDTSLVDMIRAFVAKGEKDPVAVWNFYKEVLDLIVHGGAGSSFFVNLFDLEQLYAGPPGSFQHADGSIARAPWRQALR
jgi:hypothetical protein